MFRFAIPVLVAVSACTVSQDTPGSVYEVTDNTVTIRGAYDLTASGAPAAPTAAMVAQAKAVCPSAAYMSATPSPSDDYTFLYLFRC